MKKWLIFGISFLLLGCNAKAKVDMTKDTEKLSYSYGYIIGKDLLSRNPELNISALYQGFVDAKNNSPMISTEEMESTIIELSQKQAAIEQSKASEKNEQEAATFVENFKKNKGVRADKSGILIQEIKTGNGRKPKATDTVKVHYEGTLPNGQVFDSSIQRGEPISFPLNRVIQGWQIVLQEMPIGSKWKVVIPPQLAYGEQGAGGLIGPNATLIFDIELLDIQ